MSKIYITGMGMISCLGSDTEHFWAALNQAEGEGHELPLLPPLEIPKLVDSKTARRMDHFSLITLVTSIMAFSMRGLEKDAFDPYRVGTVYNTGLSIIISATPESWSMKVWILSVPPCLPALSIMPVWDMSASITI